jgi:hypothetical protein
VRKRLPAKEKSGLVAVGAVEEQFGQHRSIKKIGEIHQIIRVFF